MRRIGIVVPIVAALGLALASPAVAADYPPTPQVSCRLTAVQAGGTVGVDGFNWLQNSNVALTFRSTPVLLGTAPTDSNGTFSTTLTIPSNATTGSHVIRGDGFDQNGQHAFATCALAITAGAAPGGGVAFTGTNVSLGLIILALLVAAGVGFLVASRRKDKATAQQ